MNHSYLLKLKTPNKDITIGSVRSFIEIVKKDPFNVVRYGDSAKFSKKINEAKIDDLIEVFDAGILFNGKGNGLETTVKVDKDHNEGITWWNFFFESEEKMSIAFFKDNIIPLLTDFSKSFTLIHAFFTSEADYNYLHEERLVTDGVGVTQKWLGISKANFYQFMPGIYWFNLFGCQLLESYDKGKIRDIPNIEYLEFGSGELGFYLKEEIDVTNLEERATHLYAVAESIDPDNFFNKRNKNASVQHKPEFKLYLEKIKKEYLRQLD